MYIGSHVRIALLYYTIEGKFKYTYVSMKTYTVIEFNNLHLWELTSTSFQR